MATTFVADGDEALVPSLIALLERSRQPVPAELRSLAQTLESDAAKAAARAAKTAAAGGEDEEDEEDERRQLQIANREKQLAKQQKMRNKGRNNA